MKNIKILAVLAMFALAGCSTNAGSKVAEPAASVQVSAGETEAVESAIAAAPSGAIFTAWVEHGKDKSMDAFVQKFDANLKPSGEKVRINPVAGNAKAWSGDPPTVAIGNDGSVFVGWTAKAGSEGGGQGNDLFLSVSRDDGKSFSTPVKVNDDPYPAAHGMHSLAVDKDGRVFVAWLDERYLQTPEKIAADKAKAEAKAKGGAKDEKHAAHVEPNAEVYFAVSNDGGKSFSANKKLAADVCPCCKTAVTVGPDGRVYVGWRQVLPNDFRHIAIASSTDDGGSFSAPSIVSDDQWQLSACPVAGPSLQVTANNTLKVAWFTAGAGGPAGVYETESTDGGKTFAPRRLIGESMAFSAPTLLPDGTGNFKTLWGESEKIYLAQSSNKAQEIGQGDLPAAAIAGNRIFVTHVKKENERRGVWLSVVK